MRILFALLLFAMAPGAALAQWSNTVAPSTNYTITLADCGKEFSNNSGTLPQVYNLPQTSGALKDCRLGFVNTTGKLVTINAYSGEGIAVGGYNQAVVHKALPLTSIELRGAKSSLRIINPGGTGGPGWNLTSATPDVFGSQNGFVFPPEGNLIVDSNIDYRRDGYWDGAHTFQISAGNGGAIQLINPITGTWAKYQVNVKRVDLTCVNIDGVPCQTADVNKRYYIYILPTGNPPSAFDVGLSIKGYRGATGNLFQVKEDDESWRAVGMLGWIAPAHMNQTGTVTIGSQTITGLDTSKLQVGMVVYADDFIHRTSPPCKIVGINTDSVQTENCDVYQSGPAPLVFPSAIADPIGYFQPGAQIAMQGLVTNMVTNAFGVQACAGQTNSESPNACLDPPPIFAPLSATPAVLDPRLAGVRWVTMGTKMFIAHFTGTIAGPNAGHPVCLQLRSYSMTLGVESTPSAPLCPTIGATGYRIPVSLVLSQPFWDDIWEFRILYWQPSGPHGQDDELEVRGQMTVYGNSP